MTLPYRIDCDPHGTGEWRPYQILYMDRAEDKSLDGWVAWVQRLAGEFPRTRYRLIDTADEHIIVDIKPPLPKEQPMTDTASVTPTINGRTHEESEQLVERLRTAAQQFAQALNDEADENDLCDAYDRTVADHWPTILGDRPQRNRQLKITLTLTGPPNADWSRLVSVQADQMIAQLVSADSIDTHDYDLDQE